MSDFYDNLLKATNNIDDITTEKYATITKTNGLYCDVKEEDTGLEHTNVPILNGANLSVNDKAIIGFISNSIYDVVCYGALDKTIHDNSKQDTLQSGVNIKTINNNSLLGSGNINIQGGGGGGSYINDFYGDASTNELIIDYDTGVSQADIVTSWSSILSDANVPSEKLTKNSLDSKADSSHTHDDRYYTETEVDSALNGKQATLVSGTNIKTVNNTSLLGSGNIDIQGGGSVDIATSWSSTTSDSKVPSEKLTKDSLDGKSDTNHTHSGYALSTDIPTKTSDLTNDSGFLTEHQSLANYVTTTDSRLSDARTPLSHTHTKSDVTDFSHSHTKSDITNFSHSHTKSEITDFPTLSTVATTGSYSDLSNKPTIPSKTSDLTNDSGFITSHQDITGKEDKSNKVTSISSSSTDTQYPSAKCVYDLIGTAINYINQ